MNIVRQRKGTSADIFYTIVYSYCMLPVSPMSLRSFLPAGPSSHAALSARRTQPEAHELGRQRLRLHPCGPLA